MPCFDASEGLTIHLLSKAAHHVAVEQLRVHPDCVLNQLPREIAAAKLGAMTARHNLCISHTRTKL